MPAGSPNAAAEYYDLRRYQLISGPGTKLTENHFAGALIPALNRLGIGPVGAFSIYFGPDAPAYYLLLPSTKLETLVTADLELAKDPVFMKAAAPFWDAPGGEPPYSTIESTLLRASRVIRNSSCRPPRRRRKSGFTICASTYRRRIWTMYAK